MSELIEEGVCEYNRGIVCDSAKRHCEECGWNPDVHDSRVHEARTKLHAPTKFETVPVALDHGAFMPSRAHKDDAGLDLYAPEDCIVPAGGSCSIDTGVHVDLPVGTCGLIVSKSGLNVNHDITSTGLIDCGYTGTIRVKLYNHGTMDYLIQQGDKVSQLVILRYLAWQPVRVEMVKGGERGDGGFGSTGR